MCHKKSLLFCDIYIQLERFLRMRNKTTDTQIREGRRSRLVLSPSDFKAKETWRRFLNFVRMDLKISLLLLLLLAYRTTPAASSIWHFNLAPGTFIHIIIIVINNCESIIKINRLVINGFIRRAKQIFIDFPSLITSSSTLLKREWWCLFA